MWGAYSNRGVIVSTMYMDREFECLRNHLTNFNLNKTAVSEHVPEIERIIRIIKGRVLYLIDSSLYEDNRMDGYRAYQIRCILDKKPLPKD